MLVRIMAALTIWRRLGYAPLLYIQTITRPDYHLKVDGDARETSWASLLTARVTDDIDGPARFRQALARSVGQTFVRGYHDRTQAVIRWGPPILFAATIADFQVDA
jgi:hypothetical protein